MGAARIDQVNTGQVIFPGDRLRAQVFFHRDRVVGTAFYGGIVGDDHALDTVDVTDASYQPASGDIIVTVHHVTRKRTNFEKRRTLINQRIDTITYQHFSSGKMFLARSFVAAPADFSELVVQIVNHCLHRRPILFEFGRIGVDFCFDLRHNDYCLRPRRALSPLQWLHHRQYKVPRRLSLDPDVAVPQSVSPESARLRRRSDGPEHRHRRVY